MPLPTAREHFLANNVLGLSEMTYEEYVLETSRRLGRLKGEPTEKELRFYREHPLEELRYSNSIHVNMMCEGIAEIDDAHRALLEDYFIGVEIDWKPDVNAGAFYKKPSYSGHIVALDAGLLNHYRFLLAPFVTLSWVIDADDSAKQSSLEDHLRGQLEDLAYLRTHNRTFKEINRLEVPRFPSDEMNLEHIYYQNAALTFVILHEVGHHVLKHTELSRLGIRTDRAHARVRERAMNDDHRQEFDADYYAMESIEKLVEGQGRADDDGVSISKNAYLLGPLLGLLGIAHVTDDVEAHSSTHPAVVDRVAACLDHYARRRADYGVDYGLFLSWTFSDIALGHAGPVVRAIQSVREGLGTAR